MAERIRQYMVRSLVGVLSNLTVTHPTTAEEATALPPLEQFIEDTMLRAPHLTLSAVVVAHLYLQRFQALYAQSSQAPFGAGHRLFLTAIIIAGKYLDDKAVRNHRWAELIPQFSLDEINNMEMEFLSFLQFQLYVDVKRFERQIERVRRHAVDAAAENMRLVHHPYPPKPALRVGGGHHSQAAAAAVRFSTFPQVASFPRHMRSEDEDDDESDEDDETNSSDADGRLPLSLRLPSAPLPRLSEDHREDHIELLDEEEEERDRERLGRPGAHPHRVQLLQEEPSVKEDFLMLPTHTHSADYGRDAFATYREGEYASSEYHSSEYVTVESEDADGVLESESRDGESTTTILSSSRSAPNVVGDVEAIAEVVGRTYLVAVDVTSNPSLPSSPVTGKRHRRLSDSQPLTNEELREVKRPRTASGPPALMRGDFVMDPRPPPPYTVLGLTQAVNPPPPPYNASSPSKAAFRSRFGHVNRF